MSDKESLRNWSILIAVLVGTAVIAGAWPSIVNTFGQRGPAAPTPGMEMPMLEIPIPPSLIPRLDGVIPIADGIFTLNGLVAVIGLTVIVIGAVVVMGAGLAFAYRLLDRATLQEKESETFQQKQAALEQKEKERLQAVREGRDPTPMPEHNMPRWSRLANILIFWLFLIFVGMMLNRTFYPTGEIILTPDMWLYSLLTRLGQPAILNTGWFFVILPTLLLLPILGWWLQPQWLEAAAAADNGDIPWDFLAVLITGLLVVGLGIGYMIYLAVPG